MPTEQLTDHFTLDEMIASDTARQRGIDNTPSPTIKASLLRLALHLEDVRNALEHPVIITSGYRCPALNAAVGGVANSAHVQGLAADLVCPRVGNAHEVARKILSRGPLIGFDQLIIEGDGGQWVHFAIAPLGAAPRREVLTIDDRGTQRGIVWP